MLVAWQDAPTLGRVFLVPHSSVPNEWLDTIWLTHGVYLDIERERESDDTVTSMVRLMALLTWPKSERRPRRGKVRLLHTGMEYNVRDLAGAWNDHHLPTRRFERLKTQDVATTIRTGRWPPARTLDA